MDAVFAEEHGLAVGDTLPVLGQELRVVGVTGGPSLFMTPLVFTTGSTLARLLKTPGTTGAVLVSTSDPAAVADRLRAAGYTVLTTGQLHDASLRLATRIYGGPVRLMVGVAFVAGVLVVALVAYTLVAEHRRDFGVLKALGATSGRLRWLALAQTMTLTALGAVAAVVLLVAGRAAITAWRPDFPVALTATSVTRTAAAALAMALLAAWLPARQVTRLNAASAFRSGS